MSKFKYYSYILVAIGAAALTAYLMPQPEERIEYRDKIKVETKIITRIVERKNPDGSSETTTEVVDTGSSTQDTSLSALKLAKKQYIVGVGAGYEWGHFEKPEYSVTVGRRIVGPLLGAITISAERVQVSGLFEF